MSAPLAAQDGTRLHVYEWRVEDPRLTVAIVHGYAEHGGRYQHVAERFNREGISVIAIDLRGHGRSSGARGHVMRFDEYHQDVDVLLAKADEGRPLFLLGHSMGGLLALHYLLSGRGPQVAGAVISSPYLGLAVEAGAAKVAAGKLMSRVLPRISIPSGLESGVLTRDPEMVRRHAADTLNFPTANARWFTESNGAMAFVHEHASALDKPLLLLYAGADRVARADDTDRFASQLTVTDRTVERLPGFFHEILNEPPEDRERIMAQMSEWLKTRAER